MPIYEYQCQACGHQLEMLQKVSDAPLKKCPECGKLKLQKLVSAPSFRLKGGGWYETDFKSGNKKNLADGGKEDKPAKDEKPAAKAETKADAKPAKEAPKPKSDKPSKGGKSKAADA
ncbi:MAG TPA: zinc ribbon domain-containing protein [Gammaproteobacteria bacterium]|nr:zinc ribbon domain-containing protein [Gammaproteobacteria bacterium]